MRHLFTAALCLLLASCAGGDLDTLDLAPSASGNADTQIHITNALTDAKALPAGKGTAPLVADLKAAQKSAQAVQKNLAIEQEQAVVDAKARAKLEAEHKADQAAVTRRNLYVLIALFVGALFFYAGEWIKLASPYTALLPNAIAGMLTVMALSAVAAVVITLWSTFGWIIRLF